jgi:uroporphyrinogen-III synthase
VVQPWIYKPVFVVGPGTHAEAQKLGFTHIYGQETGQSSKLGPLILSFYTNTLEKELGELDRGKKPLLFLVGDKRRDTLPDFLTSNAIPFSELLVYETKPSLSFSQDYKNWRDRYINKDDRNSEYSIWLSAFSPSGVDIVLPFIQSDLSYIKMASIGSTTTSYLKSLGLQVHAQAESPTLESLVQAIRTQDSS